MRAVDADELKKCAIPCEIHNGALTDLCVPIYQIDNAPTVERPHGKWEEDWQEDLDFMSRKGWKCPFCKWRTTYGTPNFCMNCGADMRTEGEP